jgi:hypothetical protein
MPLSSLQRIALTVCLAGLMGGMTPSSLAQRPLRPIEPALLRTLTDQGGAFGLEVDFVEAEIGGQKAVGARIETVYSTSPFHKTEWGKGTVIWAIDGYLFLSAQDMVTYQRSIPAGREVKVHVQVPDKDRLVSLNLTMPSGIRVSTLWERALWKGIHRLKCRADQILDGTARTSPCKMADGATIEELKQQEIGLYRAILATPGNDRPDLRQNADAELQKLLSEK